MRSITEFGLEPDPVIEAYKKDIDRTLIRENLKRTVTERLQALEEMQDFYWQAQRQRRDGRQRGDS
jgi:hypothetical protein